ncbi:STAS domain-containing protein [Streptomyces sp. NPDC090057]|uniref:STAS domain-containing protein n=1 Tax=Streptomyces sp. NPDC090057 TaxID=3365935 RepID=UPI0037F941D2
MHEPAHHGGPRTVRSCPSAGADDGRGPVPTGLVVVAYASSGCRTRVTVRGELDLNAGRHLHSQLHTALTDSACGLDLDLSRLDFCDCAGLGVLLGLRQHARRQGKTLTVSAVGPAVDRLLDLVGVRELFTAPQTCPVTASRQVADRRHPAAGHSSPLPLTTVSSCSRSARASRESVR